jgi:hypothetical protein
VSWNPTFDQGPRILLRPSSNIFAVRGPVRRALEPQSRPARNRTKKAIAPAPDFGSRLGGAAKPEYRIRVPARKQKALTRLRVIAGQNRSTVHEVNRPEQFRTERARTYEERQAKRNG